MEKLRVIPLLLFFSYVGKLLFLQANLSDAPIVAILAILAAYFDYSATNTQLNEIKTSLEETKHKLVDLDKKHDELRTHLAGLKMSQHVRIK